MYDNFKNDSLIKELNSLEDQVSLFLDSLTDRRDLNEEYERKIDSLSKENEFLKNQIAKMEFELQDMKQQLAKSEVSSLSREEREEVKQKITELISRINYHLTSS